MFFCAFAQFPYMGINLPTFVVLNTRYFCIPTFLCLEFLQLTFAFLARPQVGIMAQVEYLVFKQRVLGLVLGNSS